MKFEIDTGNIIDNVVSEVLEKKIDGKTLRQWMIEIAKHQWISVNDRLPEKNGRYLCRYEQEVYEEVCRCTGFGMFDSDIGEKGGWLVGKVTHWMPLPEPPKEDE